MRAFQYTRKKHPSQSCGKKKTKNGVIVKVCVVVLSEKKTCRLLNTSGKLPLLNTSRGSALRGRSSRAGRKAGGRARLHCTRKRCSIGPTRCAQLDEILAGVATARKQDVCAIGKTMCGTQYGRDKAKDYGKRRRGSSNDDSASFSEYVRCCVFVFAILWGRKREIGKA